ncbi:hypothetical protein ACJW30_M000200 [Castanea mollissima]
MPSFKVSLKLFIQKSTNHVLYAEAGKEFVEFLFNILRLPIGTLTTVLKPDLMLGHLGNFHDSVINMSPSYGPSMRSELIHYPRNGVKEGLYLVKNNLDVKPLSSASLIPLLNEFNVKDGDLEEKVVDLGVDEGLKLLKATLLSKDVLTDVFLPTVKPEV